MTKARRRILRIKWVDSEGNEKVLPELVDGKWPKGVPLLTAKLVYEQIKKAQK